MPGEDHQTLAIIPILEQEFDTFDENVGKLRAGEMEELNFTAYRLREGVYGQRQADSQMIRIKCPGGIITAKQMEAVGEMTRDYAPLHKGHVTTREAIQVHHLKLEDAAKSKRLLSKAGLSSREACGNTVRNVLSCPLAGVCKTELFDVIPYMVAYVRYSSFASLSRRRCPASSRAPSHLAPTTARSLRTMTSASLLRPK
jgi:sulfite reductase (ferredoxin)